MNWLWLCLGLAAAVEIVWGIASFLRPRSPERSRKKGPLPVTAGPAAGFLPGTVTAFPRGRFYLSRLPDGAFLALSRRCTHLGCTVPWVEEQQQFICPCHSSTFDIRGAVLRAPASRPLDIHPVIIENGIVTVDIRKTMKRNAFQQKQVAYPDLE